MDFRVSSGRAGIATAPPPPEAKRTVLIVDDEPGVRHLMRRWLESRGYSVAVAAGADKALELLAATPTAVALCDLHMPGHDGLWLADQVRREHPDTAVIIATGVSDVSSAVESVRQGVVDYLTKPFERDRLCEAVSRGVEWHRSACDSRRWREMLEDEMHARRAHLEELIASHFVDSDDDLDVLLATMTATNPDAYAHAYRVAALSATLARALALREADVTTVERGALLHDLGKLAMPEAVLRKPAPLTVEEQRLIRRHPADRPRAHRARAIPVARCPDCSRRARAHRRVGVSAGQQGRRGLDWRPDRVGRRRLRHDDARASLPGRDVSGGGARRDRTMQWHPVRSHGGRGPQGGRWQF